ncbi:MAG: hypothetical protein QOG79_7930 [Mycobacterium sp.]|jgi:hypothetical protein|nr:hypothetical protein [Mycobacterium sp.]MDT5304241.1 hypothetical protein [Mycobacterium sp.]MDT5318579.1 hypothetical protein [Mycobacterium sp.]
MTKRLDSTVYLVTAACSEIGGAARPLLAEALHRDPPPRSRGRRGCDALGPTAVLLTPGFVVDIARMTP